MPAAFEYGNLVSAQFGRGGYMRPSSGAAAAQAALGNTQNWAGLAAASSSAKAQRDAAWINAAADTAQQGIGSYAQLANSVVNAYGQIGATGISAVGRIAEADKAIEAEKVRRGSGAGAIAGAALSLAGLFV